MIETDHADTFRLILQQTIAPHCVAPLVSHTWCHHGETYKTAGSDQKARMVMSTFGLGDLNRSQEE